MTQATNPFRLARYFAGLSLKDASRRSGVARTTLSQMENGHIDNPSAAAIRALAVEYGLTVAQVIGDESLPAPADRRAA